jgi:TPR repeat protein
LGKGVKKDYSLAFYWIKKAAEQGYAHAQTNFGMLYHKGYGVAKDDTQAIYWLEKAAEQGDDEALDILQELKK